MLNLVTIPNTHRKFLVLGEHAPTALLQGLAQIRETTVVHVDGELGDFEAAELADVDAVFCVGERDAEWLEPALEKISEAAPEARIILALRDAAAARRLASKYRGVALPWPLHMPSLQSYLTNVSAVDPDLDNRQDERLKLWAAAAVDIDGHQHAAIAVNFSERGSLLLTNAPLRMNQRIRFTVGYAHAMYAFVGETRHITQNLAPLGLPAHEKSLLPKTGNLVGLQLEEDCVPAAAALCERIRIERGATALDVLAVPYLPDALDSTFRRFGVETDIDDVVPHPADRQPSILFVDLATRSAEELLRLDRMNEGTCCLVIGFAAGEPQSNTHDAQIPIVTPRQTEWLTRQCTVFLEALSRWEPGAALDFQVHLQAGDTTVDATGLELVSDTCVISNPEPIGVGSAVSGVMAIPAAQRTFAFRGHVVDEFPVGEAYETTLRFIPQAEAKSAFRNYYKQCLSQKVQTRLRELLQRK